MWTVFTVLLCCVLGNAVAGRCGVSAPEMPLDEIMSYCDSVSKGRTPECTAAMHRFCGKVEFPTQMTTLGVPREFGVDEIGLSCVKTGWNGDVSIATLQHYVSGCTMVQSQGKECIKAIHTYCSNTFSIWGYTAGISQEAGNNVLGVHCFKPTLLQDVNWDEVKSFMSECYYPDIASMSCFAAAKRWCEDSGYRGGIPQSWGANNVMRVACYTDEFTNAVRVQRDCGFSIRETQVQRACSYAEVSTQEGEVLVLDYRNGLGAEKTMELSLG